MSSSPDANCGEWNRLLEIMARLRAPDGCPWDREQTHASLRPYLIEESAEVLDAIERHDARGLCEELGDLALQIVFHAQLAHENGDFSADDVLRGINEKLVRRHPHVFGDVQADDSQAVLVNWQAIKAQEKAARGESQTSALNGVSGELAALSQALQISKKAAKTGFEWPDAPSVTTKLREEMEEIEAAIADGESNERVAEELGDLLFTAVNVARWRKIDPEMALRDVNRKFIARFEWMEIEAARRGRALESLDADAWNELWLGAKTALASNGAI